MSEYDYTLDDLESADGISGNDLLLIRQTPTDRKVAVSVLVDDRLSGSDGAGKIGISPVGGLSAENVQEAVQALFDRESTSPQELAPGDEPTFAGLTLTNLDGSETEMLTVGAGGAISTTDTPEFAGLILPNLADANPMVLLVQSNGTVSSAPVPDAVSSPRHVYSQMEDVAVVDTTEEVFLLDGEYTTGIGSTAIPDAYWEPGAYVEIQFDFEATNGTGAPSNADFKVYLGGFGLTYHGAFVFPLINGVGDGNGRGKVFIAYVDGEPDDSPDLRLWMEAGGANPDTAVMPPVQTAVRDVTGVDLTYDPSVQFSVALDDASVNIGFTLKNARVIWHPAPQGLE